MQFLTFAIYLPANIDFVAAVLPPSDFLKGQSLTGSAYALGSVIASFSGGILLEFLNIPTILILVLCVVCVGAVLITLSVAEKKTA